MSENTPQTTEMRFLVGQWQNGDLKACDELLRRVCKRLKKLARRMYANYPQLHRWTDYEDVLQEATLRLLRSLQQLQPDTMAAFYGLAATEIRRELVDLARKYFGPHGEATNRHIHNTADHVDPHDEEFEADLERWIRFHEEVDKLPAELREVISLVFYHGWKKSEIAALFHTTERTIRRRWQDALFQLQEHVQDPFSSS